MPDSNNFYGGSNTVLPNATMQQQIFYGDQFAKKMLEATDHPLTLVLLGAGVDATKGFPSSAGLIPRIVDYLETEEGKAVDAALRKAIGRVYFHFDKFVSNTIDRLAKDLDRELVNICHDITEELKTNSSLTADQRKMGQLIERLFRKIINIKTGAAIDQETGELISEVLGTEIKDEFIVDFSRLTYTETFNKIIVELLQRSMHDAGHPILRHVYKNVLDVEQLLSQYFYGFYTGQTSTIRDYLYISWMLWACLVHSEQQMALQPAEAGAHPDIYAQLRGKDCQLLNFNYTTYARQCSDTALYYYGSVMEYVDVEHKNEISLGDIHAIDLPAFFKDRLSAEISFDADHKTIPIPSFLPPLKLQTVISHHYLSTWYHASQLLLRATKIVILGYSFSGTESFLSDILRDSHAARIVVIDQDIDTVARNVCRILQLDASRYTRVMDQGVEQRIYAANRLTLVKSDLGTVDVGKWV